MYKGTLTARHDDIEEQLVEQGQAGVDLVEFSSVARAFDRANKSRAIPQRHM